MTERTNRKLALAAILISTIAIIVNVVRLVTAEPEQQPITSQQCMYPTRPLVDGKCDNSDPACPETIKDDAGNCGTPQSTVTPAPVETPTAPAESTAGKACQP